MNSDNCMVGKCNLSQQVHNKNRTNEPTMQQFVYAIHTVIFFTSEKSRITIQNVDKIVFHW